MDAKLKKILDELPCKPPRSRLEPYREFIEELRGRGQTYREIAEILADKCALDARFAIGLLRTSPRPPALAMTSGFLHPLQRTPFSGVAV